MALKPLPPIGGGNPSFGTLVAALKGLPKLVPIKVTVQVIICKPQTLPEFRIVELNTFPHLAENTIQREMKAIYGVTIVPASEFGHWVGTSGDCCFHLFRID